MAANSKKQWFDYETSIYDGVLYFEDVAQAKLGSDEFTEIIEHKSVKVIRLISFASDWIEHVWVGGEAGTQKEQIDTELTLRKKVRSGTAHWYAYRRVLGKLHKRYVGISEKVTQDCLIKVCRAMPTTKIAVIK